MRFGHWLQLCLLISAIVLGLGYCGAARAHDGHVHALGRAASNPAQSTVQFAPFLINSLSTSASVVVVQAVAPSDMRAGCCPDQDCPCQKSRKASCCLAFCLPVQTVVEGPVWGLHTARGAQPLSAFASAERDVSLRPPIPRV